MVCKMRIGLISDTHIPEVAQALPPQVAQVFQGVDLILHAGDIYTPIVLDELERLAPVIAARGDDDDGCILADRRLKEKHVLKLDGQIVWLIHIRPYYMLAPQQPDNSLGLNEPYTPHIVVFGHEHRAITQHHNGILFVNPGSPTYLNYQRGLGTVGILDIESGKAQVQILQLHS